MKTYQLVTQQFLPVPREQAWAFFTDPRNLNRITPEGMNFRILDELPERVYPGMIIRYTLTPVGPLPVHWVTEITQVKEGEFFIDDQRAGPYALWHHQHHFRDVEGGTEMTDVVTYALPMGSLGRWVAGALVRRKVGAIFSFRREALNAFFHIK
ncbi:MAG TPA: SRPBCC family protein [Bacteroidales bacterium]|nr:SRPBCC family protein [Bacteroidales bacterium]HRZ76106.1 SRPBCC family protein [Bacteroidales bacterium]